MSRQEDTLTLHPADPVVEAGLNWLQEIAERDGWPPALRFQLMLCLEEALANVNAHAFEAGPGQAPAHTPEIELRCRRAGQAVRLQVIDNGRPFDPTGAALSPLAATLDDAVPGGHGLRLMRNYLSDMSYRRDGDRNHLTLISKEAWQDAD